MKLRAEGLEIEIWPGGAPTVVELIAIDKPDRAIRLSEEGLYALQHLVNRAIDNLPGKTR